MPAIAAARRRAAESGRSGFSAEYKGRLPQPDLTSHRGQSPPDGGGYFDHDVIDSTKLEGPWDFELEWTPRGALAAKGAEGISVFDAVEKQLGLKVELQNTPMPATVIESVNQNPTANPDAITTTLAVAEPRFEAASIKPADPSAPRF